MRHLRSFLALVGVALLAAYFMASAYCRASNDAIQQLYAQERILAEQGAKGISEYFSYYRQSLDFLARNADVVGNTERGQGLLREFFLSQQDNLLSVTRVGADGRIAYTFPEEQAAGRSILDQAHVRAVFETRRPVVSSVFTSVQGFECVALHVPVFDGDRFAGSLAALIPFAAISRTHLEGIRIGRSGYAVLLSREGAELFCLVPGHTGRSIYDTSKAFPATLAMADRMLRGETGTAIYDYDHFEGEGAAKVRTGMVRKHAYFAKIPLEDTFWSISVTAPEAEALVFIQGFRNRWALAMGLLLVAFGAWGVALARTYLMLDRERMRKAAQERVRAAEREREQALRASEERFRTYFENSLLAMAITTPDKRWSVVNDRLLQLLGYSWDELRHLDWAQLTHPDDLAADLKRFGQMLAGEQDGYSLEKRFVHKDGAIVHTIASVRLVRGPDGEPDHCLVQLQDVTDRKRLDDEAARLGEQLRQAQKLEAIGQLAGGIAHDFNNLLTVQLGHLSLLRETTGLSTDVQESLLQVETSARMAASLTSQLLAFSRRQVLQIQRLDLSEIVVSMSRMLRRVLREDIVLDLDLAPDPLWVDADAGMMEQVVMNLVVNARDAMPDGGRLTISTRRVSIGPGAPVRQGEPRLGQFVCLTVKDTGRGMSADTRERIFDPFFTTKDVGKGTGLGLAMVYGIVEQHHGWIEVDSAEGQGSEFRVFQVAATAAAEPAAAAGPPGAGSLQGRGETILLAEDNPAVRRMLTTSLQRLNYRVLSAADAQEAERLWRQRGAEVDLLLTDMVMVEGATGLELAHALRREKPGLPVIIMSGYSEELVGGGLAPDMVFLPKPWTPEALAHTVQRCLAAGPGR